MILIHHLREGEQAVAMNMPMKAHANRLRRIAKRHELELHRSRRRKPFASGYATWYLIDALNTSDHRVVGPTNFAGIGGDLDEVEAFLTSLPQPCQRSTNCGTESGPLALDAPRALHRMSVVVHGEPAATCGLWAALDRYSAGTSTTANFGTSNSGASPA